MYIVYYKKTKHAKLVGQDYCLIEEWENVDVAYQDGSVSLYEAGKAIVGISTIKFSGIVPVIIND